MQKGDCISLGIIGCGRIGRAHAQAALEDGRCRLVALADPVRPDRLGAEVGARLVTSDYRELLERSDIDAVVIATPTDTHLPIALDAVAAGKHMLVEKPVTLDAAGAEQLAQAARAAGVTVMVAQSRRFPPAVAELVRRLPRIGAIFRIHIHFLVSFPAPPTEWWKSARRARGLVVPLQGSHSLDSILWWTGQTPRAVLATGARRNQAWEGEDEADIICRLPDEGVATVHLSLSTAPAVHEALVVGERGVLRLVESPVGKPFTWSFRLEENGAGVFEDRECFPYLQQMQEFSSALLDGRTPLAGIDEVLPAMRTMDAAIASMTRGVWVPV